MIWTTILIIKQWLHSDVNLGKPTKSIIGVKGTIHYDITLHVSSLYLYLPELSVLSNLIMNQKTL